MSAKNRLAWIPPGREKLTAESLYDEGREQDNMRRNIEGTSISLPPKNLPQNEHNTEESRDIPPGITGGDKD
jgi:hypothetical protein